MPTWKLSLDHSFDAAHRLPDHPGKCRNLHGHTWQVRVEVTVDQLNKHGMVVDFGDLKRVIDTEFDHQLINETLGNPTAELIAESIHGLVAGFVPEDAVVSITVQESPGARVEYQP